MTSPSSSPPSRDFTPLPVPSKGWAHSPRSPGAWGGSDHSPTPCRKANSSEPLSLQVQLKLATGFLSKGKAEGTDTSTVPRDQLAKTTFTGNKLSTRNLFVTWGYKSSLKTPPIHGK